MENASTLSLQSALQKHFGFQTFRPGQLDALLTLMTHGRLLCIQPTGHGKSLLYQLPSVLLDGITLVISPLLALMRDQLVQLQQRFGIPAASINTDQTDEENFQARQAAQAGNIRILFVAPEQLDNIERFEFLLSLPIRLLVVDEAHCISTWGHDFRPAYRNIIHFAKSLTAQQPDVKLLGLTATANDKTEADIKQQLMIDNKTISIHRESMNRPNIKLSVLHVPGIAHKLATLTHLLPTLQGSGLIYCATRENTELVADYLMTHGLSTVAYHAGLDTAVKKKIQHDFINDHYPVITATNALGMGIDKSNLRYIIHFDFPGSITAYYQEVGRAGRDGQEAAGILLYNPADKKIHRHFIESAQPNAEEFSHVLTLMTIASEPLNLATLKRLSGLHPSKLIVILAELIEQQFIKKKIVYRKQVYQLTNKSGTPHLSRYITQRQTKLAELSAMQHYAEQSKQCLMLILRLALGDPQATPCRQCSVCVPASLQRYDDHPLAVTISSWLNRRTFPILLPKKIEHTKAGMAVLDGRLRSPEFISFMCERANTEDKLGISNELMQTIKVCLHELSRHYHIGCIIALPSRTWRARDKVIAILSAYLELPLFADVLRWQTLPDARQGELLNNDQRRHNVENRMHLKHTSSLPKGAILLIDDYIGSGATLNEAARALREHKQIQNEIIPFAIAAVKWKLGKSGMV